MAKYEQYEDIDRIPNGTVIWAYEFELDVRNENMVLYQKPIRGRISSVSKLFSDDNKEAFNPDKKSRFFVPFRKDSESQYKWSKAINIYSRCYADTKEEAVEGYNDLIGKQIDWHQEQIEKLSKMWI